MNRDTVLNALVDDIFDIVVIGGGATGCGIALDAASRGLKTALVEKGDFASGTSSKSTKLIHGGLRYLKQFDISLVRESGRERAVVHRLAPHLSLPEKMLLPIVKGGSFGKFSTSIGLKVYDLLAGVKGDDRRKMLSRKNTLTEEPLLDPKGLRGGGLYAEYRTDDARLTIELIKKACSKGALALNYAEVKDFIYEKGIVRGVKAVDTLSGKTIEIKSKKIVSAAGPWVDHLRKINDSINEKRLFLSKGVHIVVPHARLPIRHSTYFDVPDGRMIFAIPRGKVTYIGTTDTPYEGSLDRIVATTADLSYLLKAVNKTFPTSLLTKYDVISNWAGLRPLIHEEGKSPSEMSRRDEIFVAKDGLISIAGGKLTGYRRMAERIVDKVLGQLKKENGYSFTKTQTDQIQLTQKPFSNSAEVEKYIHQVSGKCEALGLDPYYGWYLVTSYGREAFTILDAIDTSQGDIDLALALSELDYCIDHEMVQRVDDFLVRRTGRLYFDIHSISKIKDDVLATMAERFSWDADRSEEERKRIEQLIEDATTYYEEEIVDTTEALTDEG